MDLKYSGRLTRATDGSAGLDVYSSEDTTLVPTQIRLVRTGLYLEIPKGHVGLLCSRSGLAADLHLVVLNDPGVIDSDYRGEIQVLLRNYSSRPYSVQSGDRIAQLVILKTPVLKLSETDTSSMSSTERMGNGFGSTGKN
jgi:dUTP pyrophosphatase